MLCREFKNSPHPPGIDRLIPVSSSLDDLLARLQREGYDIKRGKYISARAPNQEQFVRLKT